MFVLQLLRRKCTSRRIVAGFKASFISFVRPIITITRPRSRNLEILNNTLPHDFQRTRSRKKGKRSNTCVAESGEGCPRDGGSELPGRNSGTRRYQGIPRYPAAGCYSVFQRSLPTPVAVDRREPSLRIYPFCGSGDLIATPTHDLCGDASIRGASSDQESRDSLASFRTPRKFIRIYHRSLARR